MSSSDMGGMTELSWEEISAWLVCTERLISVWDISMIKNMSRAYVSEFNLASDRARKMPYLAPRDTELVVNREAIAKGIAAGFASMTKKKKQG